MVPVSVNPFDCLSDDLLESILIRRLWNPFDTNSSIKGRELIWLGAVCRRFHAIIGSLGSLDWDLRGTQTVKVFLHYMLDHRARGWSLQRLSLIWTAEHCCLTTTLFSLVPQVAASLESFRLFVDLYNVPSCYEWQRIFEQLQTCKKLRSVAIILWKTDPRSSAVVLGFTRPLKPFPSLQSLLLYGFEVPNAEVITFLESFPLLEDLEIHCEPGAMSAFKTSPLKKLFMWGEETVGFDKSNLENTHVPRSMDMLLSLVSNLETCLDIPLIKKLQYLSHSVANQKKVLSMLGQMPELMEILKSGDYSEKEHVVEVLVTVLPKEEVCQLFAETPENLRSFLRNLDSEESVTKHQVMDLLLHFTSTCNRREILASLPYVDYTLLGAASGWDSGLECTGVAQKALQVFTNLVEDPDMEKIITEGALRMLVNLLADQRPAVRAGAAVVLGKLAAIGAEESWRVSAQLCTVSALVDLLDDVVEVRGPAEDTLVVLLTKLDFLPEEAIDDVGECVTKLVVVLEDQARSPEAAVLLVSILACEDFPPEELGTTPGCLEALVKLLDSEDSNLGLLNRVAGLLDNLTLKEDQVTERLTKMDGVVTVLAQMLSELSDDDLEFLAVPVLDVLHRVLFTEPGLNKELAKNQEFLLRLASLLRFAGKWEGAETREGAAFVFGRLVLDGKLRSKVAGLPEVNPAILVKDGATFAAGTILQKFVKDKKFARVISAMPDCVQMLASTLKLDAEPKEAKVETMEAAVLILSRLPLNGVAGDAIINEPGALQKLVELAHAISCVLQGPAKSILRSLGRSVNSGESVPGAAKGATVTATKAQRVSQGASDFESEAQAASDGLESSRSVAAALGVSPEEAG